MALKDKSPVKIRLKKLTNGNKSLFLDIYDNGIRKREYLKLYLIPEKSEAAKEANEKTMAIAETIRAERVISIQAGRSMFFDARKEARISFADYMADEIKRMQKVRTKDYIRRYKCGEGWVRRYDDKTLLCDINRQWVQGFIGFLSVAEGKHGRRLNQNTIHEYLIYIANMLNIAVREGLIPSNPTKSLSAGDRPKKYDSIKEYLTLEEVKKMMDCPSPGSYNNIRCAFLFACFCGLRYSDIEQLRWKHIRKTKEGLVIDKKLQKTQNTVGIPLNKTAESLLPKRQGEDDRVFKLPKSMSTVEIYIKIWSEFAGIDKHVTFHTSRHTFSVNLLAKGGDIYTLSKLLGHKRVSTTQIYAEIVDENKRKAVELLDINDSSLE